MNKSRLRLQSLEDETQNERSSDGSGTAARKRRKRSVESDEFATHANGIPTQMSQSIVSTQTSVTSRKMKIKSTPKRNDLSQAVNSVSQRTQRMSSTPLEIVDFVKRRFNDVLTQFGFILSLENRENNGEACNQLDVDQELFVVNLQTFLSAPENNLIKEEFLESMKRCLLEMSEQQFEVCCKPTISSVKCVSSRGAIQDSLINILLKCSLTQSTVLEMIMEKLKRLFEQLKSSKSKRLDSKTTSIASLLIYQLRCVETIENPDIFMEQLLDIMSKAPVSAQKELLVVIPNFIVTLKGLNSIVIEKFNDFLGDEKLQDAVFTAISQLSPTEEQLRSFVEKVRQTLPESSFHNIPKKTQFLLESASQTDFCLEILTEIEGAVRNCLSHYETLTSKKSNGSENSSQSSQTAIFHSTPVQSQPLQDKSEIEKYSKIFSEIVDSIISASRSNANKKIVMDSVVKFFESATELSIFTCLLLFTLIVRIKAFQRQFESIIQNKIKNSLLTELQLNSIFRNFNYYLTQNSKVAFGFIAFAKKCLKAINYKQTSLANSIYIEIFSNVQSLTIQKEVIKALISHILNGNEHEKEQGFHLLLNLCSNHPKTVQKFSFFVKLLLDNLRDFSVQNLTILYRCLTLLSLHNLSLADELDIVLRKQLQSSDFTIQYYGAVGAVAFISSFAGLPSESENYVDIVIDDIFNTSLDTNTRVSSQSAKDSVKDLIKFIKDCSKQNKELFAVFCDLLAEEVKNNKAVRGIALKISDDFFTMFEDTFLIDIPNGVNVATSSQFTYCLNFTLRQSVALNIGSENTKFMIPLFHLLWTLLRHARNDNELKDLNMLLGCPLTANEKDEVIKETADQWIVLNWFRELINGFCSVKEKAMIERVISRLDSCANLENKIRGAIEGSSYSWENLPKVTYDLLFNVKKINSNSFANLPVKVKEKRKTTKTKKKAKNEDENRLDEDTAFDDTELMFDDKLKIHCIYMRKYEWEAFLMLKYFKKSNELMLSKSVFKYLLNELHFKLASCVAKNGSAANVKVTAIDRENINFVVQNIGSILLSIIEDIKNYSEFFSPSDLIIDEAVQTLIGKPNESECFFLLYRKLDPLKQYITHITDATLFLQLTSTIIQLSTTSTKQIEDNVSKDTKFFLLKPWSKYDSKCLRIILDAYVNSNEDSLEAVSVLVKNFIKAKEYCLQESNDEAIDSKRAVFPFMKEENFALIFDSLMKNLSEIANKLPIPGARASKAERKSVFDKWKLVVELVDDLMNLLAAEGCEVANSYLKVCLRYGRSLLDSFLRRILPLLNLIIKDNKIVVIELVKEIQKITKFLQRICTQSKFEKRCLKAMFAAHDCPVIRSLGTLKPKNILGDEINFTNLATFSHNNRTFDDNEQIFPKKRTRRRKTPQDFVRCFLDTQAVEDNNFEEEAEDEEADVMLDANGYELDSFFITENEAHSDSESDSE
ncbi:Fanconi anemia group D2 protein-like protein [Dinothrombium tinctorium]|uniref:Fanconi anemia group D2 protein-like protein n=1 Tax=Dinothrombium tinctorium TaxID=1965070 RepID=A0A3S3NYQ8_9ACAR|nr:Fanconi anemia group D2 protein-like protein [Dinothrombium tinctorium]